MRENADENILTSLRSTDSRVVDQAFIQLYKLAFDAISRFIQRNSGTLSDAEDIFQDSLVVLYNQIKQGELKLNCTIKTYLYSICRNLWLKRLRKGKKEVALTDQMETIPINPEHLEDIDGDERSHTIAKLLGSLGEDCRDILLHFYFERMSMREIARKMNLSSEQVAKNKKSNCMKNLKKKIADVPYLKNLLK